MSRYGFPCEHGFERPHMVCTGHPSGHSAECMCEGDYYGELRQKKTQKERDAFRKLHKESIREHERRNKAERLERIKKQPRFNEIERLVKQKKEQP